MCVGGVFTATTGSMYMTCETAGPLFLLSLFIKETCQNTPCHRSKIYTLWHLHHTPSHRWAQQCAQHASTRFTFCNIAQYWYSRSSKQPNKKERNLIFSLFLSYLVWTIWFRMIGLRSEEML